MDISGISGVGGLAGSSEQDRGAGVSGGGGEPWRSRFIAFRAQCTGAAVIGGGIFLLILGQITDGGIGEGDGWFFIVTGFFLEPTENFMLFLSGLIFCSVYSLAYMAASFIGGVCVRQKRLPFLPFLLPVGLWLALS